MHLLRTAVQAPPQPDIDVSHSTEDRLARLAAEAAEMSLEELRACWRRQFGRKASSSLPRGLLYRLLMYRTQAQVFGDLAPHIARQLDQIARAGKHGADAISGPSKGNLRVGTTLVREYDGVHHRVIVTESGFSWDGKNFSSLSSVAQAITGTKWNGHRFFGLRGVDSAKA